MNEKNTRQYSQAEGGGGSAIQRPSESSLTSTTGSAPKVRGDGSKTLERLNERRQRADKAAGRAREAFERQQKIVAERQRKAAERSAS